MGTPETRRTLPGKRSVLLALRHYGRELVRLKWLTIPAMLLTSLGNIGINYIAPLIVAKLVGDIAGGGEVTVSSALPYVLGFIGVLLLAETLWRIALHCLGFGTGAPRPRHVLIATAEWLTGWRLGSRSIAPE